MDLPRNAGGHGGGEPRDAKPVAELKNLVFGQTQIPSTAHLPWFKRPVLWGFVLLAVCTVLNVIFW